MSDKTSDTIAVVGAGVGGLAAAARLAFRGKSVDVFERLPRCGGRASVIEDQGFKFDTGPSFVLMPDFFEEVFSYCGENIRDYLGLQCLEESYRIYYPDNRFLTIHRNTETTKQELERLEAGAGAAYDRYMRDLHAMYVKVKPLLYRCFTPREILNPQYWRLLWDLKIWKTYWSLTRKYFRTEEVIYALTFQSMFIGVSPFAAPAFYSVITYADHAQKVFHPIGGMHQIPLALERLGQKFGVKYHYNTQVDAIRDRGDDVRLSVGGQARTFDRVVINADFPYAQTLLGRTVPKYRYSCSAYLLYLGLNRKLPDSAHHAIFLAQDVRKNLNDIFRDKRVSADASFYMHVPTATDPSLAPTGKDIVYLLVPVPNLEGGELNAEQEGALRRLVLGRVLEVTGVDLNEHIETEHRFVPKDFVSRYNLYNGAAFGLAHSFLQSAFFRPANRDRTWSNVLYAGASSQPGGGLPPVLASSRIVADLICEGAHGGGI